MKTATNSQCGTRWISLILLLGMLAPVSGCVTVAEFRKGKKGSHITSDHLWANLLIGRYGLGVSWVEEYAHDAVLMDIDHYNPDGSKADVYAMSPERRLRLFRPVVEAVHELAVEAGETLEPFIMLSGGKGFWLHLFLEGAATSEEVAQLQSKIIERARENGARFGKPDTHHRVNQMMPGLDGEATVRERVLGRIALPPGSTYAEVESGNHKTFVCRLPMSIYQTPGFEDRVAMYVDLETGEFDPSILLRLRRRGDAGRLLRELGIRVEGGKGTGGALIAVDGESGRIKEERPGEHPIPPTNPVLQEEDNSAAPKPKTIPEMVEALQRGEELIDTTSMHTIIPVEIPAGQTYHLLITLGLLARAEARLLLDGVTDWESPLLPVIGSRMVGRDIGERLADVQRYICHHRRRYEAGEWKPWLSAFFTLDEVERCDGRARKLVDSIEGKGRRPDPVACRDVLLALIVASGHSKGEFPLTQGQIAVLAGWLKPDETECSGRLRGAMDKFKRIWKLIEKAGIAERTYVGWRRGKLSRPSRYLVHWGKLGLTTAGGGSEDAAKGDRAA